MNTNLPATRNGINYDDPLFIEAVRKTVAVGATPEELLLFLSYCKGTSLDPFKREAWLIKVPGKKFQDQDGQWKQRPDQIQIMTGINGYLEIANGDPAFDGLEWGVVLPSGELGPKTYPKEDYIGAWARIYRKDRRIPTEEVALLSEYDLSLRNTGSKYPYKGPWADRKRSMIRKCALGIAIRATFTQCLGSYLPEEMPDEYKRPIEHVNTDTGEIVTIEAKKIKPSDFQGKGEDYDRDWHIKGKKIIGYQQGSDNMDEPTPVYEDVDPGPAPETLDAEEFTPEQLASYNNSFNKEGRQEQDFDRKYWPYRYKFNPKTDGAYISRMQELNKKGDARFNGTNFCWYTKVAYPKLADFIPQKDRVPPTFDTDELPESFGNKVEVPNL